MIVIVNLVVSLASVLAAVMAVWRPAMLSGSKQVSSGEVFYVRMYAARAVPFGLAAGLLPFWFLGPAVAWLLFAAAMVQAIDVVVAVRQGERKMMAGATVGAIVHLVCGLMIF